MDSSERLAVLAYGSLVSRASCEATLGRSVDRIWPAELRGWRRGFIQARRNRDCEKTFARIDDGRIPEWVLGLGVEPVAGEWLNAGLIELDREAALRLDRRELRYLRRDVTAQVRVTGPATPAFDRVYTYVARPQNHAPEPPAGAVILRSYADAVEAAFAELGVAERDRYRATTYVPAVEVIDAELVRDAIEPGNPRGW